MSTGVRCTDTELELLRPFDELPGSTRIAVAAWLRTHGIEPDTLPVGVVVERDYYAGMLQWREQHPDGDRVRRWRYATPQAWPAPFPESLRLCG